MGTIKITVYHGNDPMQERTFKNTPADQRASIKFCQSVKDTYMAHPYWKGYDKIKRVTEDLRWCGFRMRPKLTKKLEQLLEQHTAYCTTNNITRPAPLRIEIGK